MGGKLPSCRTNHPLGKQAASRKPRRKNAQRRTSTQPQEPKPPSTSAKPQSPRKPGRRRMNRTGGQRKQPHLNLNEAKSSKSKSLGDQGNRKPGACLGEEPPDDAVDRGASPETSTSGSDHSNQEEKATQRQTGSQGET